MSKVDFNYPGPKHEYKVLVRCMTYNHSKYIKDALKGFAMQQTNFSFVCLVMDDASTDGEQDIIQKWMERECDMSRAEIIDIPTSIIIIVPHKTNSFCTFAFYLLKQNLYGDGNKKNNHVNPWREKCEYEAICEGDDYWIDSSKLQNQVSFLDSNLDYAMCYTKCKRYIQDNNRFENKDWGGPNVTFESFLRNNTIPTHTVLIRIRPYKEYNSRIDPLKRGWKMGDYPLWLYLSHEYKIKFLNSVTGVYRVLAESASHFSKEENYISFANSSTNIALFFIHLFKHPTDLNKFEMDRTISKATHLALIYDNRIKAIDLLRLYKRQNIKALIKTYIFKSKQLTSLYRRHIFNRN